MKSSGPAVFAFEPSLFLNFHHFQVINVGWLIAIVLLALLSWLGWRLNQLETNFGHVGGRDSRLIKRLRRRPRRRKHHH